MRRVPALLAVLSLAVTGCTFSSVDADAPIHISGRALDASGKPLSGAQVLLFKEADIGEVVFGTVLAIGTLSTICLLPDPPAVCRKAHVATADADGRYEFELKGSDTQGTLGTESTLNAVFSGPKAQGSTTISFTAKDTEIALPDARLWRSSPGVSLGEGPIRVTWSPIRRHPGSDPAYAAQLFETASQTALWSQPADGDQASIDPRILEDQSGAVAVSATSELSDGSGAGDVRVSYLSPRVPVDGTAGAPPSRGRPCAAVTGTSRLRTGALADCGATDGDLDSPGGLSGKGDAAVTGVVVDLGSPRPIGLVVARGFVGQLLVEVSDDGRTYRTVATDAGSAAAITPTGDPSARFVRLRSPAGLDESLLSEISVW